MNVSNIPTSFKRTADQATCDANTLSGSKRSTSSRSENTTPPSSKRSKKGPPAEGLKLLAEERRRKRSTLVYESDSDSDVTYSPSTEASSDSEMEDTASDMVIVDKDSTAAVDEWLPVKAQHESFSRTLQSELSSLVPEEPGEPFSFYGVLIDDEIVEYIVVETNQIVGKGELSDHSQIQNWTDTNAAEMRRFMGLLLWMGLVKMPALKCYWQTSSLYQNGVASSVMTQNRFQLLLRMWHFGNNSDAPAEDRLFKIRAFLQLVLSKFAAAKQPGQDIAIDETMVPFRGRLKFRQYIPGKAHKYGIKLFKLCDRQGYTYNIDIYIAVKVITLLAWRQMW